MIMETTFSGVRLQEYLKIVNIAINFGQFCSFLIMEFNRIGSFGNNPRTKTEIEKQ